MLSLPLIFFFPPSAWLCVFLAGDRGDNLAETRTLPAQGTERALAANGQGAKPPSNTAVIPLASRGVARP